MSVLEVGDNLFALDLFEDGHPFRTSAYVIRGPEPTLIETGSSASHASLLGGLQALGYEPDDIRHVIVTHVHLDHAGGAGMFMEVAPHAILHAHPKGARHLIDPGRLEEGVRAVYGDVMDTLYGAIIAVPSHRVRIQEDLSTLDLGEGRVLTFYDSPGHAKHHFCVWDNVTRGIFSGDTIGIHYRQAGTGWDFDYGFPTTSPSDFDPDVMLKTLDRLEALEPEVVYHTHFGPTRPAADAFLFSRKGIRAIQAMIARLSDDATPETAAIMLRAYLIHDMIEGGHRVPSLDPLALDINLDSQGMIVYMQKKKAGKL